MSTQTVSASAGRAADRPWALDDDDTQPSDDTPPTDGTPPGASIRSAAGAGVGAGAGQVRASAADMQAGRAQWLQEASEADKMTMVPFRGPASALAGLSPDSPKVKRLLARAGADAKRRLRRARRLYNPVRVAAVSTAVHAAGEQGGVTAARAAAAVSFKAVSAASVVAAASAAPSGLQVQIAWDGGRGVGADFTMGGAATPEAQLARDVFRDILKQMGLLDIALFEVCLDYDLGKQLITSVR